MDTVGSNERKRWQPAVGPEEKNGWHPLWQLMWVVTTVMWVASAYMYPVTERGELWGIWPTRIIAPTVFAGLFLVPELWSIRRPDDRLPPLTHMIRGYVPDDATFPAIYFLVGSVGGLWFGFPTTRHLGLGMIAGTLGWLTIHFTMAYIGPDPRPGADASRQTRPRPPSYIKL